MDIENATPNDVPSKLRPLVGPFQGSPFHVAPEREKEMLALRDKHDIRIYLKGDAKDWLFQEFRMGKRIFVGLRTLERLWAYCYGYNAIASELQAACGGTVTGMPNPEEYKLAFAILEWANQKTLAHIEGPWPEFLPDPSLTDELKHVRASNHIFVMMSGRLLLHEFAHTILQHHNDPETSPEILKQEELEADAWADSWILDKWRDYKSDDKVFIGRCMGIAFAHAPTLILGINAQAPSPSHPSPIERILNFIDRHLPNGNPLDKRRVDFPCAFLITIASHVVFMKTKSAPPIDPIPTTYREWFLRFAPCFP